jgi:hypothetical protein
MLADAQRQAMAIVDDGASSVDATTTASDVHPRTRFEDSWQRILATFDSDALVAREPDRSWTDPHAGAQPELVEPHQARGVPTPTGPVRPALDTQPRRPNAPAHLRRRPSLLYRIAGLLEVFRITS